MTSTSFRDSANSLGWSRRDTDVPVRTSNNSSTPFLSRLQSLNPFGQGGGYVQLPTQEVPPETRRDEQDEEGWFSCKSRDLLRLVRVTVSLHLAYCDLPCKPIPPVPASGCSRRTSQQWDYSLLAVLLDPHSRLTSTSRPLQ